MAHIADNDRAIGRCIGCGNVYVVRLSPEGDVTAIGVPGGCTDCGGGEFTVLESASFSRPVS